MLKFLASYSPNVVGGNGFAFASNLGTVSTTTTEPIVWAIGLLRDPAVQSITTTGQLDIRSPYWRTAGISAPDIVCWRTIIKTVTNVSIGQFCFARLRQCHGTRSSA